MAPKKKKDDAVEAEPAPPWAAEGLEVIKVSGLRGKIVSQEPWQIQWDDGNLENPVLVWAGTSQAAPAWADKGVKVVRDSDDDSMPGWIISTQPWQLQWQDGNKQQIVSWAGLTMIPQQTGHFVLLVLDEVMPVEKRVLGELCAYVEAFFGRELKVVEVPVTPIAPDCPQGWEALKERCQTKLESKPGRPGAAAPGQLLSSQLLYCLQLLQENPMKYGVDVMGAECILGLTLNEFYHDPSGLRPDEPCPEAKTKDVFIRKKLVGACSVAQLDFTCAVPKFTSSLNERSLRRALHPERKNSQQFPKQIFQLVTNSLLALMGLRNCGSHQCCAYMKPFALGVTPLQMCNNCEEALLKNLYPGSGDALIKAALTRYGKLADVLSEVGDRLAPIQLGHRKFTAFEEECDWMQIAMEILTELSSERFRFTGTEGPQNRRRSLHVCLREVHDRQTGRTLHRNLSEPLIKRTCLVDMTKSAPHRHESGEMTKWLTVNWNKTANSGGHYLEMGGTLRPKTIGTFVHSGLNASLVQKVPKGQLPRNLENMSDQKLAALCGRHRLECEPTRGEQLKAVENIVSRQSMRENRLNRRQFYGTDIWRKTAKEKTGNAEIGPRGTAKSNAQDWRPMRSRSNAASMSYTTLPSFSATM